MPPPPPSDSRGTYLPTGWRIVGGGAARVAEQAGAFAVERIEPGIVDNTLYVLECTTNPTVRGRPTVERVLDAITDEVRRSWAECPRLLRDTPVEHRPSRFGGLRYDVMMEPGKEWVGEIVWRSVHPIVPGAPITTRVIIEERPSFTRLGIRVTADDGPTSVRGYVGAGHARPVFVDSLRGDLTFTWMGSPVAVHPIEAGGVEDFVRSVLEAPDRAIPVAVLSPLEEGGYVIEPADLAWALLGRARLHLLQKHQQTFELSDAVGDRRMGSYRGAARCYLPGWSRHDAPHEHPFLIGDRLADPIMRATWLGEIGMWVGKRIKLPPSIDERRGPPGTPTVREAPSADPVRHAASSGSPALDDKAPDEASITRRPKRMGLPGADSDATAPDIAIAGNGASILELTPLLRDIAKDVTGLATLVQELLTANTALTDEVERLRTITSVRSSSTNAIERRLDRLEDLLAGLAGKREDAPATSDDRIGPHRDGAASDEDDDADEGLLTVADVVRDALEAHSDALLVLDTAIESATDSPYEDPERVRALLDAMARVARRRRDGVLGTSLREAFGDFGIDYRGAIASSTSAKLRQQYRFLGPTGDAIEAEEHIVLGKTYDPRRCLRIYFSSRVPNEPRFVVGHVGRHFVVQSSS